MVSAFGGTDAPTTAGKDPVKTASDMAQWVIDNGLDGIDVDYEVRLLRNVHMCKRINCEIFRTSKRLIRRLHPTG